MRALGRGNGRCDGHGPRRIGWIAAIAGLVMACSSDAPTESSVLSGTFDLVTIDNTPVPFLDWVNMAQDTLFITGGEVRTLSRGRASLVLRTRWHTPGGGPQPEASDTLVLTYGENGSTILFNHATYEDTAEVAGTTLIVKTRINRGMGVAFHRAMVYYRR